MKRTQLKFNPGAPAVALLSLSIALWASPASGIVINDITGAAGSQGLGASHTSVVFVSVGTGFCSGTLIATDRVLTAKHCTDGVAVGSMSVSFGVDRSGSAMAPRFSGGIARAAEGDLRNAPDLAVGVSGKLEIPPVPAGSLLDGTDVAVLRLDTTISSTIATPMKLWDGTPTGVTARTVGFGLNGLGSVGHGGTDDGLRWAGDNVIDTYGMAATSSGFFPGSANIFSTDFDNPTGTTNTLSFHGSSATMLTDEATTAPGDSGGPLIVDFGGEDVVIGVLSGGTTATSVYGDISWWTGIGAYRTALEAEGAVFVPEPSTASLAMLAGAFFIGVSRKRRR